MVPGIGPLNAISVQAINIFAQVTKTAAQFGTPIRLCCADAAVYTVAQETIRNVYQEQGQIERYDPDYVRFISDRQFAFAAGVSGIIHREKVAATFLLGEFYAESLILAETANLVGAIQIAGSTQTVQTPFFIATCDYVLIGDEFYAASAFLTREPVLVGSLVGQDWSKMLIVAMMLFGFIWHGVERREMTGLGRVNIGDTTVWGQVVNVQQAVDDDSYPIAFLDLDSNLIVDEEGTPFIDIYGKTIGFFYNDSDQIVFLDFDGKSIYIFYENGNPIVFVGEDGKPILDDEDKPIYIVYVDGIPINDVNGDLSLDDDRLDRRRRQSDR